MTAGAPLADPIVANIVKSGLQIGVEDWQTIPQSSPDAPLARLSILREALDDSGRLFTNDLRGALWMMEGNKTTLFADLSAEFTNFQDAPGLGTGFSSFAFHPDFATNGKFYTNHSEFLGSGTSDFPVVNGYYRPTALEGVITEWTMTDPTSDIWAGSHREVMRVDFPGHFHSMQEIAFNLTAVPGDSDYGHLYIGIGDGGQFGIGTGGDASHRLDSVLGTILRIDPLGNTSANGQYGLPVDNPFATDEDPSTLAEIFAWGFRNPHRMTWDPVSGKMLVGEIGQDNIEEVNLIEPGRDYGWYLREGTFEVNLADASQVFALPEDDDTFGFTYPVAMYDHDEGFAIAGGHVYRGSAIPELYGQYVFADLVTGRMFHVPVDNLEQGSQATIFELTILDRNGNTTTLKKLMGEFRADVRLGLDDDGEIYLLTKTDGKLRLLFDPNTIGTVSVTPEDDVVNSTDADQSIDALGGHDIVRTGDGNDLVRGGDGDDTIEAAPGDDTIVGGTGDDRVLGDDGHDVLYGNGGADFVSGGDGLDSIYAGTGSDTVSGGSGDDEILGQGGLDQLWGDLGNDTLRGGSGDDTLEGGSGNDLLFGQGNNDLILGDAGDDTLHGAAGLDTLKAGDGNDLILGGLGRDDLDGGSGNDTLNGGAQADTFVFASGYDMDRINGFEQSIDVIELHEALWDGNTSITSGQDVVDAYGNSNTTGTLLTFAFDGGEVLEIQSSAGLDILSIGADVFIV